MIEFAAGLILMVAGISAIIGWIWWSYNSIKDIWLYRGKADWNSIVNFCINAALITASLIVWFTR